MDREIGNETEFDTRNGREMGNDTEFETRNGRKWETRRYKIHHFSTINEKNRVKTGKTGEKSLKNRKKQKITRNTETSFGRGSGKRKRVFGEISGNAENGNGNDVFPNVTKRRFESKNKVSVRAYPQLKFSSF